LDSRFVLLKKKQMRMTTESGKRQNRTCRSLGGSKDSRGLLASRADANRAPPGQWGRREKRTERGQQGKFSSGPAVRMYGPCGSNKGEITPIKALRKAPDLLADAEKCRD